MRLQIGLHRLTLASFLSAETEEHQALVHALALIRDAISQANDQVSEYERAARLREIGLRLEPKSQGWQKDNLLFRREDLLNGSRALLHEGTVTWKSSGRHKGLWRRDWASFHGTSCSPPGLHALPVSAGGSAVSGLHALGFFFFFFCSPAEIHALLLSDVVVLLQEKDQKLVFAAVVSFPGSPPLLRSLYPPNTSDTRGTTVSFLFVQDNKPPIISLERLIVREVANEEKAMFLIYASAAGMPEMYEIHTSSREERITWMTLIWDAIEQ